MDNKTKSVNVAMPAGRVPASIMAKVRIPRKFEIYVEEFDETKEPGQWKPVLHSPMQGIPPRNPIITVNSQEDFLEKARFYKELNQRFRIIREIDPPSPEDIIQRAKEQGLDVSEWEGAAQSQTSQDAAAAAPQTAPQPQKPSSQLPAPASKPKVVTVGGVQIKYDGDKVYQKQWIRLTDQEAANFRVVNATTNKTVSMAGKAIEARRWVLVEDAQIDDDGVERLINV